MSWQEMCTQHGSAGSMHVFEAITTCTLHQLHSMTLLPSMCACGVAS